MDKKDFTRKIQILNNGKVTWIGCKRWRIVEVECMKKPKVDKTQEHSVELWEGRHDTKVNFLLTLRLLIETKH